jgi:hypothetical protein
MPIPQLLRPLPPLRQTIGTSCTNLGCSHAPAGLPSWLGPRAATVLDDWPSRYLSRP